MELCALIDCSRNAVMRPEELKKYGRILSEIGYSKIALYMTDVYEIPSRKAFGHMRGRYGIAELKELNEYFSGIGMELIPCIQTLSYLDGVFKWGEFAEINDCGGSLLLGEEKTYGFIEEMISSIASAGPFSRIHIGMNGDAMLGHGKYYWKNGSADISRDLEKHISRVCGICEKHGMIPIAFSDMISGYVRTYGMKLPKNLELMHWDYFSASAEAYAEKIKELKEMSSRVYFLGGAWSWEGFAPDNGTAEYFMKPAMEGSISGKADGAAFGIWGDDGAECSKYAVLPALVYGAYAAKGEMTQDITEDAESGFEAATGCSYRSFMLLDELNVRNARHGDCSAKYLLYNDVFLGLQDWRIDGSENGYYEELSKKLRQAVTQIAAEYRYIFDTAIALSEVLEIKSELGVRTRTAYKEGTLSKIVEEYDKVIERLEKFRRKFEIQWMKENKPYGFEIQDMRLGGLKQRIESCKNRILSYLNGETERIEELEEEIITGDRGTIWSRTVTTGTIAYYL